MIVRRDPPLGWVYVGGVLLLLAFLLVCPKPQRKPAGKAEGTAAQ